MSRYELTARADHPDVVRGTVGWDRPLQSFFAQLFTLDEAGEEAPTTWHGTYPGELNSAAAALKIVAAACHITAGLAAQLETDRLATLGSFDTPAQRHAKRLLAKPTST